MGVDRVFSKKKHFYEESANLRVLTVKREAIVIHFTCKLVLRRVYF